MTTNELRAKFEAWFRASIHYGRVNMTDAFDIYQASHASRDAEVEALKRDAEKWRHARDNQGNGLRIIQWDSKAIEELQVMFPSPALSDHFADAAMAKESQK